MVDLRKVRMTKSFFQLPTFGHTAAPKQLSAIFENFRPKKWRFSQKRQFFAGFFGENILKIITCYFKRCEKMINSL
jgi:hypothetical protein